MKHQMFVIYDAKANAYLQPWFLTTDAMALRAFNDCVNDKKHNFGLHPEDYTLFKIGEFNDANANINWQTPHALGNGLEFLLQEKTNQLDLYEPDHQLPQQHTDGEDT